MVLVGDDAINMALLTELSPTVPGSIPNSRSRRGDEVDFGAEMRSASLPRRLRGLDAIEPFHNARAARF